jgi:hypothetical protein
MFRSMIFVILMFPLTSAAAPGDLLQFLKTCGWGTLIGAGAGTISLAFENKPSEHTINIARGASLGLYGGILYGISAANAPAPAPPPAETWGVIPRLEGGRLSGVDIAGILVNF